MSFARHPVKIRQSRINAGGDVFNSIVNKFIIKVGGVPQAETSIPEVEPSFVGRREELEIISGVLNGDDGEGQKRVIITGLGGVGKTELALAAGWDYLKSNKDARAVYLKFGGYSSPVSQKSALKSIMLALGVEEDAIPDDVDRRAALYRATLDRCSEEWGAPILLVFDDVRSVSQVELLVAVKYPLIVTSRNLLAGVSARCVEVSSLDLTESMLLILGALKIRNPSDFRLGDVDGISNVADRCAGLPLALNLASAIMANYPDMQPEELSSRLESGANLLSHLELGERRLKSVFEQSVSCLSSRKDRDMFKFLGVTPGPDISTDSVSVLVGCDSDEARSRLRALAEANLVTFKNSRWVLHDLVQEYARDLHKPRIKGRFRRGQIRLLNDYSMRASEAYHLLAHRGGSDAHEFFNSQEQASEWLDNEMPVLVNSVFLADEENLDSLARSTSAHIMFYLDRSRLHQVQVEVAAVAVRSASKSGNAYDQAVAFGNFGNALRNTGSFKEALTFLYRSYFLFLRARDGKAQAGTLNNLGEAYRESGNFEDAIEAHASAIKIYSSLGDKAAEMGVWNNIGLDYRNFGDIKKSIEAHERDLDYCLKNSVAGGEAVARNNLGSAYWEAGEYERSAAEHSKAASIFSQIEDSHGEAGSCSNIGRAHYFSRRFGEAAAAFHRAGNLYYSGFDFFESADSFRKSAFSWGSSGSFSDALLDLDKAYEILLM